MNLDDQKLVSQVSRGDQRAFVALYERYSSRVYTLILHMIHDQSVKSGTVLVDSLKPGWIAIFTDNNGQPGTVLGYTAVPAGTSSDVAVKIDASKATSKMLAVLLEDAGTMGAFEYPGADEPVKNTNVNTVVMESFNRVGASS